MIVFFSVVLLILIWLAVEAYGLGWWNTVDCLAYWLHQYAVTGRKMHATRTATVTERWVRSLESE